MTNVPFLIKYTSSFNRICHIRCTL